MKTRTIEVYNCDYCNKLYQVKKAVIQHELICTKNPVNKRPCFECEHLTKAEYKIYFDAFDGEHEKTVNILYCKKKQIFVYPPRVEIKNNAYELGYMKNEPMPKDCNLFELIQPFELS